MKIKTCKLCKKVLPLSKTQQNTFCNKSCAAKYNNVMYPKRSKTNKCSECDTLIKSSKKVCSPSCYAKRRKRFSMSLEETRIRNKTRARRERKSLKEWAVKLLGGKCEICGYNKCLKSFDFHHKEQPTKDFAISEAISHKMSRVEMRKELKKCTLLCANCHREIHDY